MSDDNDTWETIFDKAQEEELKKYDAVPNAVPNAVPTTEPRSAKPTVNTGTMRKPTVQKPKPTVQKPKPTVQKPTPGAAPEEDVLEDDDYETYDLEAYEKEYNQVVRIR